MPQGRGRGGRRLLPTTAAENYRAYGQTLRTQLGHQSAGPLFPMCGTGFQIGKTEPHRLTPMFLAFRNIMSIREYEARNGGNQGHGRYLHVWRWEADIAEYDDRHNVDWQELASNITDCFSLHQDEFIQAKVRRDNFLVRGHKRCRREYANNL